MEDSEVVRRAISENLPDFGYEVEFAREGNETISKYKESVKREQTFDVVLIDLITYEGLSGEDTIKELLRIDPKIRAVVTSGYTAAGPIIKPEKYGFKAAIAKPFGVEELEQTLSSVLKEKS